MTGPRVLILEDELFVALDLEAFVHKHDPAAQIVICSSLAEAHAVVTERVELALLDVDVIDGKSFGIAASLHEQGVPLAFVSGSRPDDVPPCLSEVPFIAKPFAGPAIQEALQRMTGGRRVSA